MNLSSSSFIEIDGVRFYSDRFYLNAPTGLPYYNKDIIFKSKTSCKQNKAKKCQCQQQPPLFDRSRLIQSLDLKAAIVGTYTFDPQWISKEIPALFPLPTTSTCSNDKKCIPTLLLHGHQSIGNENVQKRRMNKKNDDVLLFQNQKYHQQNDGTNNKVKSIDKCETVGYNKAEIEKKRKRERNENGNIYNGINHNPFGKEVICIDTDSDDESTSQIKMTRKKNNKIVPIEKIASIHKKKLFVEPTFESIQMQSNDSTKRQSTQNGNNNTNKTSNKIKDNVNIFGKSVHVTQVLPQWIPPNEPKSIEKTTNKTSISQDNIIVIDSSSDEDDCLQNDLGMSKHRKKRCMGVFHPKFMLLFEKSGSIVVLVSTSNLSRPRSVDGTWMQRFHRVKESGTRKDINHNDSCDGSDFGFVLCDLLQRQSDAAGSGEMTPVQFLNQYLGITKLMDFCKLFSFHEANVHLISVVPGSHPGRFGAQHLSKMHGLEDDNRFDRRVFYGPQRVSDILHKCSSVSNPWLPSQILSHDDKLIVQTTSFGAKWNKGRFYEMVRQYMGFDDPKQNNIDLNNLINNVNIIWPSKTFMEKVENEVRVKCDRLECEEELGDDFYEHFTFLSSESFNLLDQDCLSRMTKYDAIDSSLFTIKTSPHIKSYARVMTNYQCNKDDNLNNNHQDLAWFLLTSACLSRGAQGQAEKIQSFQGRDEKSYLNFELGVMFCSRLQNNHETDRLYRSYDSTGECTCDRSPSIIKLPIPYSLKSPTYQQNDGELDFDEDPFLHEISLSSAVKGNMALTPFGKKIRNAYSHQHV